MPVHTVFFGGGTPSLLPAKSLAEILDCLHEGFKFVAEPEITLEANPGTLTQAYLRDLKALGINRLSLGVQSARPEELRLLERQHTYPDVIQAVTAARRVGFSNLNLDLIFGLPDQKLPEWQHNLELALQLGPEHFSLYALTLEHGTPLAHWAARGLLNEPDPDTAADMYEWAMEYLEQAGYIQYEISNWGRRNGEGYLACRHNLQYWHNQPYLGFGAGAHGYADGIRTANVLAPAAYIQRCLAEAPEGPAFPRTPATQTAQSVDRQAEIGETMMMGLRLVQEGISAREFEQRFGESLSAHYETTIAELLRYGLIEWAKNGGEHLRLTKHGRLLGNQVFYRFI